MNADQLDRLGKVSDRIDNILGAMKLKVEPAIHMAGIENTLPELRDELRALYLELSGGDNPWHDTDT